MIDMEQGEVLEPEGVGEYFLSQVSQSILHERRNGRPIIDEDQVMRVAEEILRDNVASLNAQGVDVKSLEASGFTPIAEYGDVRIMTTTNGEEGFVLAVELKSDFEGKPIDIHSVGAGREFRKYIVSGGKVTGDYIRTLGGTDRRTDPARWELVEPAANRVQPFGSETSTATVTYRGRLFTKPQSFFGDSLVVLRRGRDTFPQKAISSVKIL